MEFPWMIPKRNAEHARSFPGKREAMYLGEIEERAGLLFRLGYSKDRVRERLLGRIRWDFELHEKNPRLARSVDTIVDRVWARGSRRTG